MFYVGMEVTVIDNSNNHNYTIGETYRIKQKSQYHTNCWLLDMYAGNNIRESDMKPAKMKLKGFFQKIDKQRASA